MSEAKLTMTGTEANAHCATQDKPGCCPAHDAAHKMLAALQVVIQAGLGDYCVCDADNTPEDPCRICWVNPRAAAAIRASLPEGD